MIALLKGLLLSVVFIFADATAFAQDLSVILPEGVDKFSVYIGLVVLAFEYLVANTNLVKSNSTIDLVLNGLKKVFGLGRFK